MKKIIKKIIKKKLIRLLKRLCDYNVEDLLLYKELTAWQDINDPKAPSILNRPVYSKCDKDI
jgi:hypothetical protein